MYVLYILLIMELDYENFKNSEKEKLCSHLFNELRNCIMTCSDISRKFSFDHTFLKSLNTYDCNDIKQFSRDLKIHSKILTIVPSELNTLKNYSIKYSVQEKQLILDEDVDSSK